MTRLEPGSSIKRTINIPGIEKPLCVEMTSAGLSFWISGSRKRVQVGWTKVVQAGVTGSDVPSFLMSKPFELLQHQAAKAQKKAQ